MDTLPLPLRVERVVVLVELSDGTKVRKQFNSVDIQQTVWWGGKLQCVETLGNRTPSFDDVIDTVTLRTNLPSANV